MTRRVAVNLLWCVPGVVGGSEEYLARQLGGLDEVDPDHRQVDITLFTLPAYPAAHPELTEEHATVCAPVTGRRRPVRVLAEHSWLAARTRGFDLVHHGGGTAPLVGSRPALLTIHDLQYLEHPEYVSPRKLRYLRTMIPRSARRAAAIAVPSEFVRGTVIDGLGVDPERVVVVPHGVPPAPESVPEAHELRERYALGDGPVLVYPAITHPHKNHGLLLRTLASHWTDPDLRLVLLGGRGAADTEVESMIDELGLRQRVIRPGRVPDADRDGLVALAEALVFPSSYEGFGAPVIEAMALGTPVICSDHPTVREVVGDAGLVCPDDPEAWGAALAEVGRERAGLVARGRVRVERFTPATSAAALVEAYELAHRWSTDGRTRADP